jgi:hypothetical protein
VHVFFDNVNVDQYSAPADPVSHSIVMRDTSRSDRLVRTDNYGAPIYTTKDGRVFGQFVIPKGKFKFGDRVLEIADTTDLTLGGNAITTFAKTVFNGTPGITATTTTSTTTVTTVHIPTPPTPPDPPRPPDPPPTPPPATPPPPPTPRPRPRPKGDPLAQILTITTPNGEPGIFATSLTLYFKKKPIDTSVGVSVYICDTLNGYPDGNNIIPFSQTRLSWSEVNVSDNASAESTFVFESPVFLADGQSYAFVVKPDKDNPDYATFTAVLGNVDLASGVQMYSQPVTGTAFYGALETQWTALQSEYVKFKLNRAKFTIASGKAVFENNNVDYLKIYDVAILDQTVGIHPGDYVYTAVNSSSSNASTVDTNVFGRVIRYDTTKGILYIKDSTGNFPSANSFVQIRRMPKEIGAPGWSGHLSGQLVAYANSSGLHNPLFNATSIYESSIVPVATKLNYSILGTSNTYNKDSAETFIEPGIETELRDYERRIISRSNEVAMMSSAKSYTLNAYLETESDFVSPLIDTINNDQNIIGNLIDGVKSVYNEFFDYGHSKSKYISEIVTLAENQDAEDLQVIVSAYMPAGTDVQVYVRFLNSADSETIEQKTWTPLALTSSDFYSDPSNPYSFNELVYKVPVSYDLVATLTGTITSNTSSNIVVGTGTTFTTELQPGWFIRPDADGVLEFKRQILSIEDDTHLTLTQPFLVDHTSANCYITVPPTVAYNSVATSTPLTGNVITTTTSNIITGVGTQFTKELQSGSIFFDGNDSQYVVSVISDTSFTVGTPWSANSDPAGILGYSAMNSGLTYNTIVGAGYNNYTSFKRFQLKVILQSDSTAIVPIIDNIRAIALQI